MRDTKAAPGATLVVRSCQLVYAWVTTTLWPDADIASTYGCGVCDPLSGPTGIDVGSGRP